MIEKKYDVVIVGGLGHVGLPLGLVLANKGLNVCLYDINKENSKLVKEGRMPFIEYGSEEILKKTIENKLISVSTCIEEISLGKYIIIAIGTPIDEYLNPNTRQFLDFFKKIKTYLKDDQIIIIRSTVYPKTCKQVEKILNNDKLHIAYCPERIIQGYAVKELNELPQIIAGLDDTAIKEARNLFKIISPKVIITSMGEAELVKLFSNAWRYIQFAVTNQFYMISKNFGVDYDKVRYAMTEGYGRTATLPTAGFAAGPCLLKDTMQLAAFNKNNFLLGHAAMMVNEGLPSFIVEELVKKVGDLTNKKVGILGMTFKSDIDDIRDSLSFKLGKILRFHGANVYYSDEYAKNQDFIKKEELIKKSEIIIIGVAHSEYKKIKIPKEILLVDLWGIIKK